MLGLFDFLRRPAAKRTAKQKTGDAGERAAERFLRKAGYRIVARNVTYPQGEVDLVALERTGGALCFVEVRSRTEAGGGRPAPVSPEESVTLAKRRRVLRAARRFIAKRKIRDRAIRFDVVTVRFAGEEAERPEIRHYPGAFDAKGRLL
jgi:putative endonuclease